jgi:PKD repeat protein
VTYSTTGSKTVTLTVNGTSTQTKTNYINVISSTFNMSNLAVSACSGNFYDPGGSGSNYSNNQDFTMVFNPATANSNLQFVFSSFSLEDEPGCNYDYLKIYNGSNTTAPLIGTYCGTNSPGTVTASNTTGSLTFVFHSDGAVVSTGWAATLSCVATTLPPVADFMANNITPETGSIVSFTDLSINAPTSWLWAFSPNTVTYVNGTSVTFQNPQLQFNNNGIYSASLTATNTNGSNVKTKTNYLYVGTAGLWTGITSSDWNTPSNWQNYIVPSALTNVSLPSSALHWPSLSGNMILGSSCHNLVLSGNSVLMCSGNFVINPGDTLTFSGPGTLKTEGDWSDYGIFNAGNGNVEFTGSTPAKITGGIDKRIYVANYNRVPFTKSMKNISEGTGGPSGDDAYTDVNIGFSFNYLGASYSQARISTNGWISLNATGSADAVDNSDLFSNLLPASVVAPWWDDLSADATSSILYKTEGVAPDRTFIAEWKRVLAFYSTGTTARLSFQVKLYETSNSIEFCYGTAEAGNHDISESASIGIKDETGGSGHFKEATTGSTTTGVTDLSSASEWPMINYRFTPPSVTGTFNNLIENKTNATLTIQPDIIINGDVILK